MNITIETRKHTTDLTDYKAGLLDYWNSHWATIEQFESRFDVLASQYADSVGAYCEIITCEDDSITVVIDNTDVNFTDTIISL